MAEYEVLVVSVARCPEAEHSLQCLEEADRDLVEGRLQGEDKSVSVTIVNLNNCTQHRAIVRSKGAVTQT